MSRDADSIPAASLMPRVVSQTTPCLRCGYDLVGVSFSAVCPECGLSVERTTLGDPLHFSEASYLKSLARGMTMIRLGLLAMLVLGVVPLVIAIAFFASLSHRVRSQTILTWLVPPILTIFLSHIAVAAGHYLIATP